MTAGHWIGVATVAIVAACAPGPAASPADDAGAREVQRRSACRGSTSPLVPRWSPPETDGPLPFGKPIYSVAFHGGRGLPPALLREQVHTRVGDALDAAVVADDVRRLMRLEIFEDVRVTADERFGQVLVDVHLADRPVVRAVYTDPPQPSDALPIEIVAGELYEPARVARLARKERERLVSLGHLDAEVEVRAVRSTDAVDLCVAVVAGERYVVASLDFEGNGEIDDDELAKLVAATSADVNRVGAPYDADLLERAVLAMKALYYDRGMIEVRVAPPEVERSPGGQLAIKLRIDEGPVYAIGRVEIGASMPGPAAAYAEVVASLESGRVFRRTELYAFIERLEAVANRQGAENFTVTPASEIDPAARLVHLRFDATPSE